jgi:hypothetical protein
VNSRLLLRSFPSLALFHHGDVGTVRLRKARSGDHLRSEGLMPEGETSEQAREFFIKWFNQPAAADLPERMVGTVGKMTFLSSVLGCRLKLVVEDDNESIFLSERLLGNRGSSRDEP